MGRQTPEGLRRKIKDAVAARKRVPCYRPRQGIYYCRYADDYDVILCGYSKQQARQLKTEMADWLQQHLGVTQHPDKTRITHWDERSRFLGFNLHGRRNLNGTRWLQLTIPPDAERSLKERLKRLCGYTQIPESDLILSVNAQLRGWTQYYRYASNATQRFGYLTGVAFWLVAHYLGRKHRSSIKKLMRTHYGVDPQTGRRALYITQPDGKRLFLWNKPPPWRSILTDQVYASDAQPVVMTSWAGGHSYQQRQELQTQNENRCQHCGKISTELVVHHPHRLGKQPKRKQGPARLIQSAEEQEVELLCPECHRKHHPHGWRDGAPA